MPSQTTNATVFIDPSYSVFNNDKLFDLSDPVLNRDDQLLPFVRLRQQLFERGVSIHTADMLSSGGQHGDCYYYSLGILDNFEKVASSGIATLKAFICMEPPLVAPKIYESLPQLTSVFERTYVPNTWGDGYSLEKVNCQKLECFHWPITFNHVLEPFWSAGDRLRKVVVVNGNHKPASRHREHYSTRIDAMAALAKLGVVDLFGRGWNKLWGKTSTWPHFWRHYRALMSVYRGPCASKYEVLSRYKYCLCFENMSIDGYITEKIFDCIYAGTIPLYLGAPNVASFIPEDVYIDVRRFSSWEEMWDVVKSLPESEINLMRQAGRQFLSSESGNKFYNSFRTVFDVGV